MYNAHQAILRAKQKSDLPFEDINAPCPDKEDDPREYFVIHCTAAAMTEKDIKEHTGLDKVEQAEAAQRAAEAKAKAPTGTAPRPVAKRVQAKRSKAHVYVNPDGTKLWIWPFTERNVWATKAESRPNVGKQKMVHVELNYGGDDAKPTEEQYETLADLYIEACRVTGKQLVIVPHIEVDRGLAEGHKDPENFDYNKFYEILRTKGVPIDSVKKFSHDRYWGKPSYKMPFAEDKFSFPPVLSGNPHAKPK